MRGLTLLGCLSVVAVSVAAQAEAKTPVVAVFNVEMSGAAIAPATVERLGSFLAGRLAASGAFEVVPRSQVKMRLVESTKESYRDCYDQACQIELGREMAADKSVAAEVLQLGGGCTVNLALYDLGRATTDVAASADGPCTEVGVVETIKDATERLVSAWQRKAGTGVIGTASASPAGGSTDPSAVRGEAHAAAGLTEVEWRSLWKNLGASRATSLVADYRQMTLEYRSNGGSASFSPEESFWQFAETRLRQKRDDGKWTTVAGLASIGVGLIVGGAVFASGSNENDFIGCMIWVAGVGGGGIVALVGGPIWGVYQNRLDALLVAKSAVEAPRVSLRWTGVSPFYDRRHGTTGAVASFSF